MFTCQRCHLLSAESLWITALWYFQFSLKMNSPETGKYCTVGFERINSVLVLLVLSCVTKSSLRCVPQTHVVKTVRFVLTPALVVKSIWILILLIDKKLVDNLHWFQRLKSDTLCFSLFYMTVSRVLLGFWTVGWTKQAVWRHKPGHFSHFSEILYRL